jgi:hypothetical protein
MVGIPIADHTDPNAIVMVPLKPQELTPPIRPADPDAQAEAKAATDDLKANPPPPPTPIIAPPGALHGLPGGKGPAVAQGAKPAPPAKPGATSAKPAPNATKASDAPFAARNAAFLADLRELRDLGFEPDIDMLAEEHNVPVPKAARK